MNFLLTRSFEPASIYLKFTRAWPFVAFLNLSLPCIFSFIPAMASKHHFLVEFFLLFFAKLIFLHTVYHALIGDYIISLVIPPDPRSTAMHRDGLKVIACGFSRSGTMSLKLALDHLGFPCYHGKTCLQTPTHPRLWLKAARESFKRDDLEKILHGYSAIADFPAACFYKELLLAFPEAKVILNTRDPEDWYQSFLRTMWMFHDSILFRMFRPAFWTFGEVALYEGKFKGKFEDKEFAIGVYEQHIEEVKRHVPKDKLLVYQNKDGWGPLCDFLQVRTPEVTFPRVNDTQDFQRAFFKIHSLLGVLLAVYMGLISCIVAVLFNYMLS